MIRKIVFYWVHFLFFSSLQIYAQWFWQNPQIPSNKLLAGDNIGPDKLIIVGDAGLTVALNTITLGYNYSYLQSSQNITDVQFIDDQKGWLITADEYPWYEGGKIFKTEDGGLNWTNLYSFGTRLKDLYVIDSLNILLLTIGEVLYRTSDGGITWAYNSFNRQLNRIEFVTDSIGFIVGYSNRRILKTTNMGQSWGEIYNSQFFSPLHDIKFYNEMHGFIAGESGYIYETIDGGNNWDRRFITAGMYDLFSILLFDSQKIIVLGRTSSSTDQESVILFSPDTGLNWFEIGLFEYWIYGISKINETGFLTTADKGIVNLYHFTDSSWTQLLDKDTRENIVASSFVNQQLGWCLAEDGTVLKTVNSGNLWTKVFETTPLGDQYFDISFSDKDNGWIIGVLNHQLQAFFTTDAGANWNQSANSYSGTYKSVFFISKEIGWIAGHHENILKTTDGGITWQAQGVSGIYHEGASIEELQFFDENMGYAGGGYISGINPYGNPIYNALLLKTTNGGEDWDIVFNEEGEYIVSISFINSQLGYALKSTQILKTADGGETFINISTPLHVLFSEIHFLTENDGWIAGSEGKIYKTSDAGISWNQQRALTRNTINDLSFLTDSLGWFVGNNGAIFRFGVPTINNDNELKIITNYRLAQNYPNPFNPNTIIKFTISDLPAGRQGLRITTLKVYDILGNEIATLVSEEKPAGEYEIEFNGEGLSSGIYFYQLRAGNYIETKKMVLLK